MWYVAHAIYVFTRRTARPGDDALVEERMYLISAKDPRDAIGKATSHAQAQTLKDDTLTYEDQPAQMRFVGIRKLISVQEDLNTEASEDRVQDLAELTYSCYRVAEDAERLGAGKPCTVEWVE